jgi:hypothetical protein
METPMKILLTLPQLSPNALDVTELKTLREDINAPFQYSLTLKMTAALHLSLPTKATLSLEYKERKRTLQGTLLKYSQSFSNAYPTSFLFCSPLCLLQLKASSRYFPPGSLNDFLTLLLPCTFSLSPALTHFRLPPLFQTNENTFDFLVRQLKKFTIQYLHQHEPKTTALFFFKNIRNTSQKHWKFSESHTGHLIPSNHSIVKTNIIHREKNKTFHAKSNCPLVFPGDTLLLSPEDTLFRVTETCLTFKKGKTQHSICYIPANQNSNNLPIAFDIPLIMSATLQGKPKIPAMDDKGEYSAQFHFDLHTKKYSLPLSKMQIHPCVQLGLREKTEVVVGFSGNSPFILGCHFNRTHASPTTQTNPQEHVLITDSGHQWIRHDGTHDSHLSTTRKQNGLSFQGKNDCAATSLFSENGKLSIQAKKSLVFECNQSQIHHTHRALHVIQQDYLVRTEKSFSLTAHHNQTWRSTQSILLESYAETIILRFNTLNARANNAIVFHATDQWQMCLKRGGFIARSARLSFAARQTSSISTSGCALELTPNSITFSGNVRGNAPSITFFT